MSNSTSDLLTAQLRRPPTIRPATVEDYDQIAALQIRNDFSAESHQGWTALWRGNPAYRRDGQWPIGWVLQTEGGDLVGWIGNVPSAYQFRGRTLRAATPHSWIVDPSHRGYGTQILKCLMRQAEVDLFICTNVSSRSELFTKHLRLSRVPVGAWDKSVFWITNYRGFMEIALRMKSVPLASSASYLISAALFCRDRCSEGAMRLRTACEVAPCYWFDRSFDDFWQELQHQNENVVLAVRTPETLAWHFGSALSQQRAWILAAYQGSRLTAYAVFDRQDNPAIGLQRIRLVDFQALKGSEGALASALSWMLNKCREQGTHVLEVNGCWLDRPGLPRIRPPYQRTMPSWSYYYRAVDPELSESLKDPRVWAPSSFDGDASL